MASLSYLEKMRRLLILLMKHSTRWRSLYRWASYSRGVFRLDRGGMTGTAPRSHLDEALGVVPLVGNHILHGGRREQRLHGLGLP